MLIIVLCRVFFYIIVYNTDKYFKKREADEVVRAKRKISTIF